MTGQAIHIAHVFPSFDPGGAETRMARAMNGLGERFRHTVIALDGRTGARTLVSGKTDCTAVSGPAGGLRAVRLWSMLRKLKPDVVATYNWGAFDAVAASAFLPGVATVHNECGLNDDEARGLIPRRLAARQLLLNGVWRTVAVSKEIERRVLEEYRVERDHVRFIQSGVDAERFKPGDGASWRMENGIEADEFVIGFVGRLRSEKDLGTLFRAALASGVADARLVIVGEGPDRARLERLAAELGLGRRVLFTGNVSRPERAYRAFDVFAMSSTTEGAPNALMEAMASGLACVATDVGDCRFLLGDGQVSCLAEAGDWRALGARIARLAGDAECRARMGEANRARAAAEFSFARMVEQYGSLYEEAASRRG